jgi:hypothetical protein
MGTDIIADLKQENFRCRDSLLSYTIPTSHVFDLSLGVCTCAHTHIPHTHTHTHTHHIVLFCWEGPHTYHSQTIWRRVKWRYCNILTSNLVQLFSIQLSHCSEESQVPCSNLLISKQCWWLVLLRAACSRVPTFLAHVKILIWLDFTQHSWWVLHPFTGSKYNM